MQMQNAVVKSFHLPRHYGRRNTQVWARTHNTLARNWRRHKVIRKTVIWRPEDGHEDSREERYDEYGNEEKSGEVRACREVVLLLLLWHLISEQAKVCWVEGSEVSWEKCGGVVTSGRG
jgi:hypothetical protein